MGFLEGFLIGGLVGGTIGVVAWILAASRMKGRSVTSVRLPRWTSAQVLQAAGAYFAQQGMVTQMIPDGVLGRSGSEWVTTAKVLEVRPRDRDGGADVRLDAYLRALYQKEMNIDPNAILYVFPRRKAFQLAQGLLASLGVLRASWQHYRAR